MESALTETKKQLLEAKKEVTFFLDSSTCLLFSLCSFTSQKLGDLLTSKCYGKRIAMCLNCYTTTADPIFTHSVRRT